IGRGPQVDCSRSCWRSGGGIGRTGRDWRFEGTERPQNTLAVPQRQSQFSQVLLAEGTSVKDVDVILGKDGGVALEARFAEPVRKRSHGSPSPHVGRSQFEQGPNARGSESVRTI